MLSYPSDEVGNHLISMDQVDEAGVDPYSDVLSLADFRKYFGIDYYLFDKTQISYVASIIYMVVFAAVCFILFMVRYNAKREQF